MKWWMIGLSLFLTSWSGFVAQSADERCVLRFERGEVDVVRGELRVDLNRRVQRECRGMEIGNIRLDQVTVELREDRSSDYRRDDSDYRRDDRGGRRRGGDTLPIYRFYNGRQHVLSADQGERDGYRSEGTSFNLFRNGGNNRVPIYACVTAKNDHFLSPRSDCEGQQSEGQLGYIGTAADQGQPLYRCFNGKARDHIATKDQNECTSAGYTVESTLGYVP